MNERDMLNTITTLDPDGDALRRTLSWHLSCNHYPPVPSCMVDVCLAAIDAANDDDWDRRITLPVGVSWRDDDTAGPGTPGRARPCVGCLEGFLPVQSRRLWKPPCLLPSPTGRFSSFPVWASKVLLCQTRITSSG